jgi:hypothetical protein
VTEIPHSPDLNIGTDRTLAAVAQRTGGLSPDEHACIYGAALAQQYGPGSPEASTVQADTLAQAVVAFRSSPCRLCHHDITQHALDLTPHGANVRCLTSEASTPVPAWLGLPATRRSGSPVLSGLLWVGIPLLSVGFASWLMPAIGGGLYRRRSWIVAAIVLVGLIFFALADPSSTSDQISTTADTAVIAAWFGGALYGAFQIKPWLNVRTQRRSTDGANT